MPRAGLKPAIPARIVEGVKHPSTPKIRRPGEDRRGGLPRMEANLRIACAPGRPARVARNWKPSYATPGAGKDAQPGA